VSPSCIRIVSTSCVNIVCQHRVSTCCMHTLRLTWGRTAVPRDVKRQPSMLYADIIHTCCMLQAHIVLHARAAGTRCAAHVVLRTRCAVCTPCAPRTRFAARTYFATREAVPLCRGTHNNGDVPKHFICVFCVHTLTYVCMLYTSSVWNTHHVCAYTHTY
jgi:hypothetical protein